ncbi:sugar transferase [uncultured Maritimibacter sp.]|uniref:sugar transferase n=1 Tax=uncultured Maritimibacter sp. TaxID=991866 RepID=UPI000A6A96E4|nr:sugar transferase [uncultured Maritimibacter sp.]
MARDVVGMSAPVGETTYGIGAGLVPSTARSEIFWHVKRLADIAVSVIALPVLLLGAVVLYVVNKRYNPGPLFFVQERMGRDQKTFNLIKFRSMAPSDKVRGADDPLENDRITPVGLFIRRTRVDELPQFINILKGEMSLIGPRPDMTGHSLAYLRLIPDYRHRFAVRPGITGLAQTTVGYAEGVEATRLKAQADAAYVGNASYALDAKILLLTVLTILKLCGK